MTILLFLIICLTITAVRTPFTNHFLNSLEALSLMSSAITVYCGIFFIADASDLDCKILLILTNNSLIT